jgi:hypothetical protein
MCDPDAGAIEARIMSVRMEPLRPTSAVGVSPLAIHPARRSRAGVIPLPSTVIH